VRLRGNTSFNGRSYTALQEGIPAQSTRFEELDAWHREAIRAAIVKRIIMWDLPAVEKLVSENLIIVFGEYEEES
jgi:hypothetical protein